MTVYICIDKRGGMLFNNRRQSRDSAVIDDILASAEGKLFISDFSKKLLFDKKGIKCKKNPLEDSRAGDHVFCENLPLKDCVDKIGRLVIYNWNRLYPSDVKLDIDPTACSFILKSRTEFVGTSHEKITKEIYEK